MTFRELIDREVAKGRARLVWSSEDGWTELGRQLIPTSPLAEDAPHDPEIDRWHDDGGAC